MRLIRISAVWCTSCLVTHHIWELLKEKYPNYSYEEVDYDFDEEMVKKYEIGSIIPVIIVLNDKNEEITRIVGEKSKEEIFSIIDKLGD